MKTSNKQYDYVPLSSWRVLANFLRWKLMPFGYLERGPGVIWLLSILLRHRFGRLMASLQIKHNKWFVRLLWLRQKFSALLGRFRKS